MRFPLKGDPTGWVVAMWSDPTRWETWVGTSLLCVALMFCYYYRDAPKSVVDKIRIGIFVVFVVAVISFVIGLLITYWDSSLIP